MDKAEKNALMVQREGLKKKLTLVNNIERARMASPQKVLKTTAKQLSDAQGQDEASIPYEADLHSFLDLLKNDGAITDFRVVPGMGRGWGSDEVIITLNDAFNDISTKVRREYYKINGKIREQEIKENRELSLIYSTSIYWQLGRFYRFIKTKAAVIIELIFKFIKLTG